MLVDPARRRKIGRVDLPHSLEHRRRSVCAAGAVHHVAIDTDGLEHVVRLGSLLALECLERDLRIRIPQTDAVERRTITGRRAGTESRVIREVGRRDVIEVVSGACGLDVAGDIGTLEAALRRVHLEGLQRSRVDHPDDQCHHRPHPHRQNRQCPAALANVHEKNDRGEQRDPEQQLQRRKPRVDVGVTSAVHISIARHVELVALQQVPKGLDHGDQSEQHGQMNLDSRAHSGSRAL